MIVCEKCFYDCQMVKNYSEIGHGNVEVDGVGALLKREIQKKKSNLMQGDFNLYLMWWYFFERRIYNTTFCPP